MIVNASYRSLLDIYTQAKQVRISYCICAKLMTSSHIIPQMHLQTPKAKIVSRYYICSKYPSVLLTNLFPNIYPRWPKEVVQPPVVLRKHSLSPLWSSPHPREFWEGFTIHYMLLHSHTFWCIKYKFIVLSYSCYSLLDFVSCWYITLIPLVRQCLFGTLGLIIYE
jgi:hypothetical protein